MCYILLNKKTKRPLSYFYPNCNGEVKNIIGFSYNDYFSFNTEKEAKDYLEEIKHTIIYSSHWIKGLFEKVNNVVNNITISRRQVSSAK